MSRTKFTDDQSKSLLFFDSFTRANQVHAFFWNNALNLQEHNKDLDVDV